MKTLQAVAYVRVSTEEQATEGVSLDAQREAVGAYCRMRGLQLLDVVADAGVSAGKPLAKREGVLRVLDLVRRGEVQAVVALKLDRLFRNCEDCLSVTSRWDRIGVSLHLVDLGGQAIDTSSAVGRFFITVMAGAAELERNMIRERTTSALAHKASRGERVGKIPYGFTLSPDGVHLQAVPEEQETLEMIRKLDGEGVSMRGIARRLNAASVPARGTKWFHTTVAHLLRRGDA